MTIEGPMLGLLVAMTIQASTALLGYLLVYLFT
ncbi:hypothetical protein B0G84_3243 [Paraburkholderia sp. BL8N3]|nr:hypothetical protein B0G84_3243 [Paraburkholderia sp. BL8N3]